jgi:hypothetical protein
MYTVLYTLNPETVFLNFKESSNQFLGIDSASLCSLAGRGRTTLFLLGSELAPIDCSKIPAQILFKIYRYEVSL